MPTDRGGLNEPWQGVDPVAWQRAAQRVRALRGFYVHLAIYLFSNIGMIASNLMTVPDRLWFPFPLMGWGAGVLAHGLIVWSGGARVGANWEQRKIAEYLARDRIKVLSTEKQLAEAQLRLLQAQIEPHFLFNTLANVVSLIESSPARATTMLEHFIAYLRASLVASRSVQGTVGQEAGLLRHYLQLLQIRMGDRLAFSVDVDPTLDGVPLAPMLLQPVVENAVRHGLEPKVEGGRVDVSVQRDGDRMRVRVVDDGLGFKPGANAGVGLHNLRERLAVLYDGDARLAIEERDAGTLVTLDLPLASTSPVR